MRSKILFTSSLLFFAVLLSACSGVAAAQSTSEESNDVTQMPPRTITVTGSGKTVLSPDIAYINIGVQTEGKDAAQAVSDNNQNTQQVIDALLATGVAEEDIQTTNFNIYPRQEYDPQGQPTGEITYVVNNTVYVTVRDLDQVGDLLNTAVASGANTIHGIQFDVADNAEALSDARVAAIKNAETIASELANAAGVTLGEIHSISTLTGGYPVPMFEGRGGGGTPVMAEAAVPISPGQMIVTVDVTVIYLIE
jgi:uncharacterized protein YggE